MGGVRAALLARLGFTGPPAILEGKRGVLQAFCNAYDPEQLTNGLGEVYQMMGMGFKPYCACALTHAPIDVISKIMAENNLKPEDIEEIEIGAPKMSLIHVGSVGPEPHDIAGAQFSVHFALGLAAAKGANDFQAYMGAVKSNFKDPDVLNVSRRVTVQFDQECDQAWPAKYTASATVKTKDGRVISDRVNDAKGSPGNPMSREEIEEKFMGLATAALSEKQAEEVKEMVMNLEGLDNINKLSKLLVA
jgi:2-methylcitrate dehydratase PrpD